MSFLKFNLTKAITYDRTVKIPVVRNCNGFMFTNLGDTIASVNGMIIFPSPTPATDLGDSRSIIGNVGEIYSGFLDLQFQAPLGATPLVEVVQKYYWDETTLKKPDQ